jgi:hypothetical protein
MTIATTRRFRHFVDELRVAIGERRDAAQLLDGRAGARCLELVGPRSVQRLGAFFTPTALSRRLVDSLRVSAWRDVVVLDPACGAGDLLLPVARRLKVTSSATATLRGWNKQLFGLDLSPEFVEAARWRLLLLSIRRGSTLDDTPKRLVGFLTNVKVGDGLHGDKPYSRATHIVMNPPYGRVAAPADTPWKTGQLTAAALFMDMAVRSCKPGTTIVGLLPEVLRTGSNYAEWRAHVSRLARMESPRSVGLFSPEADVDVFVQRVVTRPRPSVQGKRTKRAAGTMGNAFEIRVGTVVPHRDKEDGEAVAYLHAGNAAPWGRITRIAERRRYDGRLFRPPFVAIRRTSRPGDSHRAVASLVVGKRPVAVENHLIVLRPRKGGQKQCQRLVVRLRSSRVNSLIDRRIRCRHLTVGSVASLPWS